MLGRSPGEEKRYTYSSILSWKITRTEEPGRLQSMGSQRVGYESCYELPLACHWTRGLHGCNENPLVLAGELSKGFLEEVTLDLYFEGWVCWFRPFNSKNS